jgi:hypothetical protein
MEIYTVEELLSVGSAAPIFKNRSVKTLRDISSVMKDLPFFACEKWEPASDRSGNGNTANIGSIKHIEDIFNGHGVFSRLGEETFDEYWKNYGKISVMVDGKDRKITGLRNYLSFKGRDPAPAHHRTERKFKALFATKGGKILVQKKGSFNESDRPADQKPGNKNEARPLGSFSNPERHRALD